MDLQWMFRIFQIEPIPRPPPTPTPDLRSFLIGKWHQEYLGYVCENVLAADGTFSSITVGGPFRQDVRGRWEVRDGNWLWQEWDFWNPVNIPKPLPDGTMIEVIDADHFRNKLGVATRMR
jgi:hypothetical protein